MTSTIETSTQTIRQHALPLIGTDDDYAPLVSAIGDRSIVLLGESTHGTHEFYKARFEISKRLIEDKSFASIALDADNLDCARVNREINSQHSDSELIASLTAFRRFPMWVWRNSDFLETIQWLWVHNRKELARNDVSLHGLDTYNTFDSIRLLIQYLDKHDPSAAARARKLYSRFESHDVETFRSSHESQLNLSPEHEAEVTRLLTQVFESRVKDFAHLETAQTTDPRRFFSSRQNAEDYYRQLIHSVADTWNTRATLMADTVDHILEQLEKQGRPRKLLIWAHNSHVGDERATEMAHIGQYNLGQLLRERYPNETYSVGFTTYTGTIEAASDWDEPPLIKSVQPAIEGSYEHLFHRTGLEDFLLFLNEPAVHQELNEESLERNLGVIYNSSASIRNQSYLRARLASQFDAVIHFDHTREAEPIDRLKAPENESAHSPPEHHES